MSKQRIVDCFIFYNEIDMLEYRLSIMYPYVDAFVIVESTRTHRGSLKPLYFYKENVERFAKYLDKIVHIIVHDMIAEPKCSADWKTGEQWINERHQRNAISMGIDALANGKFGWKLTATDLIFITDVDEIIDLNNKNENMNLTKLEILTTVLKNPESRGIIALPMDMYYYNLKCKFDELWTHGKVITYEHYLNLPWIEIPGMEKLRNISECVRLTVCCCIVEKFGWHLSCFGSAEMISNKLSEFAHQEFNNSEYNDVEKIRERMEKGMDFLRRNEFSSSLKRIEFSDNQYLPPFPHETNDFSKFPFCL